MALQRLARGFPGWVVLVIMLIALAMGFLYAPTEAYMGPSQRIMYFHVASAWNAVLAFIVVFVASLRYLLRGGSDWDRLAYASAEVGVFFTSITLLSGSVWGRAVWGTWWTWEPRLTTTLLLWFLYVGYLVIRSGAEGDAGRERLAAVFALIAFIDIPIVFMAVYWWHGLHPITVQLDARMSAALYTSALAFTCFYLYLLGRRLDLERLREQVLEIKDRFRA